MAESFSSSEWASSKKVSIDFNHWFEAVYRQRQAHHQQAIQTRKSKTVLDAPTSQSDPQEEAFASWLDEIILRDTELPEWDNHLWNAGEVFMDEEPVEANVFLTVNENEVLHKVGQRNYLIVVCYDIANPKRLKRAAQACLRFGQRVQRSVYECHLTLPKYNRLVNLLSGIIDERTDYLRIYRLAGKQEIRVFGQISPSEPDDDFVIIG
jgi:CRISPR-associated protein Cas2